MIHLSKAFLMQFPCVFYVIVFIAAIVFSYSATAAVPEIAAEQPALTNISDGGSKSFGSLLPGSNTSLTFTIRNTGDGDLTGLGITIDGTNASDFSIVASPTAPVLGPNGTTTFTVRFAPTAGGAKTAALHIANNDTDENPFDINLTGTGTTTPDISVEQPPGTSVADGGTTAFGNVPTNSSSSLEFTIKNPGSADLTGLGIIINGTNASDFSVIANATSPIAGPAGSTTFTVRFAPATAGAKTAALHIANNVTGAKNPYDINLTGTGFTPPANAEIEMDVLEPTVATLTDNVGVVDYGATLGGVRTFRIRNIGSSTLTGIAAAVSGANAADFSIVSQPPATIQGGTSATFQVTFNTAGTGHKNAALQIASNDSDENPFRIALHGQMLPPEIEVEVLEPSVIALTDNASSVDYGAIWGVVRTFRIRNKGDQALTGLAATLSGANVADFIIISQPSSSVEGGTTAAFQVAFAPGSIGNKSAMLQITCNDSDENPFDIALTGTKPTSPISIAIASPATNSAYTALASVIFTSITDPDSSNIKVEYYSGINKLGESTTGPDYSFAWSSIPGIHSITAKATDNSLGATTSAPITVYVTSAVTQGLKGEYYANKTLTSPIFGTRTDAFSAVNVINFSTFASPVWPTGYVAGLDTTNFSVRWSGQILATKTGNYKFATVANDGTRLYVNGIEVINNWVDVTDGQNATFPSSNAPLSGAEPVGGRLYDIVLEYYQNTGTGSVNLKYTPPNSFQGTVPQNILYPDSIPIIVNQPAAMAQTETLNVSAPSGATSSGNLSVTVTSALIPTTLVSVPLVSGTHTSATLVAGAIVSSLNANPVVGSKFTASNSAALITLTVRKEHASPNNDLTLNVAITTGLGVSAVNTSTDGLGSVISSLTKDQGTPATFTVLASGHNLSYQWRKNSVFIPGANSSSYTIPYCTPEDAAQYSVLVSNSYGVAVSNSTQLTVTFTDSDSDGIQDWWETANGMNPNSAADAPLDSDGDGMSNLQEFLAGTDPTNPNSKFAVSIGKSVPPPGSTLSFTAQAFKSYSIQYKDTLTAASWITLQTYPASSFQHPVSCTDSSGAPKRFYRVVTP